MVCMFMDANRVKDFLLFLVFLYPIIDIDVVCVINALVLPDKIHEKLIPLKLYFEGWH